MNKETCLVPSAENEKLPEEESYNFITECFFLTHQCINMSFHTVHEKFVKLNQELHRIQRLYQEVRGQGSDEVEPVRSIKQQMEKGIICLIVLRWFTNEVCQCIPHCTKVRTSISFGCRITLMNMLVSCKNYVIW